jgi:anti-sigma B factor antagonist
MGAMSSAEGTPELPKSAPLASIESSEHDGVHLVTVTGELDISNVGALEDAAFDLPNEGLGVVLDLSATSYIDSATLGLLFKLRHALQRRGQALRVVCGPESSARRVLDLTGFDRDLACDPDCGEAIAAIRREVVVHE